MKRDEAAPADAPAAPTFWELLEAVPDAMVVVAEDGRLLRVNEAALHLFGYSREELDAQPLEMLLPERFHKVHPGHRGRYLESPKRRPMGTALDLFGRRKDGTEFPAEISLAPMRSSEGLFVTAVVRDVSARKRAEAMWRESDARYHSVLDNMLEAVQILGFDWRYLYLNDAAARNGRQVKEEMLGHTVMERFPGFEKSEMFAALRSCMEERTARVAEFEFDYPDGSRGWFEFSIQPVPEGLFILSLDITARKRVEHEIRALNADLERRVKERTAQVERLAAIVDSSDDAIIGRNLEGVVTSWNKGAERLFGYPAEEMLGRPLSPLFPPSRAEEEARLLEVLSQGGRVEHFETVRRRRDGRDLDVSASLSPILDASGRVIGISKIVRDISETKRAQEALARAKSAAEAANQELESFSYSVAHDLRAPLRSIDGFSQALVDDCLPQLDPDGKKYLSFIRESAQQMAQLIDDLLSLSRVTRSDLRHQRVDLSALARAALERLQRSQPERRVETVLQDGLVAEGDPQLLGVVLDNLLGNAWKFTGKHAAPRIEFGATSKSERWVYFVRDNGAGFDMAYAHKLFGVFQRLHAASEFEGTGVGLAIVHRVVGRHGGRVWGEGETDRGATFYFTLNDATEKP